MKVVAWWTKKRIIHWRAFFRKLINEKQDDDFQVPKLMPEDIVNISNHNLNLDAQSREKVAQTQLEIIKLCLDVESSTEGWRMQKKKGVTYFLKFIDVSPLSFLL